ncbi:MAG: type II toxin-antitoxin system RelE/ParE family toxin [Elusimicrobia bacterium]|nr:type II toxin-antitoxin system RelE/ParE family toxin [Elusimicrobiota bacterium]
MLCCLSSPSSEGRKAATSPTGYRVPYRYVETDLPNLDAVARKRVLKAIHKKLTTHPKEYGRPLHGELFGYWKLRVDDYRVVYRMREAVLEVFVIQIGIRRDFEVYESVLKRLSR